MRLLTTVTGMGEGVKRGKRINRCINQIDLNIGN